MASTEPPETDRIAAALEDIAKQLDALGNAVYSADRREKSD
jgi:hypothetical protein